MIQLTKDQHHELTQNASDLVHVVDPVTNLEYVFVRADEFERLNGLVEKDFHVSDAYAAIDEAFAEGWNHPKMSDYDHYEDFKK